MASAPAGGGDDDPSCVLRAVVAGDSAERVRQLIEGYASSGGGARTRRSYEARRKAVVNHRSSENNGETPLRAAHRLARGDLVGALLENGGDPTKALGPDCSALALAIHYGLPNTLRVLLRDRREDPNARIAYLPWSAAEGGGDAREARAFCRPAHLAVVPPRRVEDDSSPAPPPQLGCLEVLVREFGADVHGGDEWGQTPLHWVAYAAEGHRERALAALVALRADVNRADEFGQTPIFGAASRGYASLVQALLDRGAATDVVSDAGITPLIAPCFNSGESKPGFAAVVAALLAASSAATRRALCDGASALDILLRVGPEPYEPWKTQAVADMLAAGVPLLADNAPRVLPVLAACAARRWREVRAAERSAGTTWQEHDETVQLAFDFKELREAEEGVRIRERRVEQLEEEVRRRGGEGGEEDDDEASG